MNFIKKSIITTLILGIVSFSFVAVYLPSLNDHQSDIPNNNNTPYVPNPDLSANVSRLEEIYDLLQYGGVRKDGIPSINNPQFMTREDANSFLDDDDIIFGIIYKGEILAFPRKIMAWHEIANVKINGSSISVTYCPLTGSSVGYVAILSSHQTTFGVSGNLANSNLVMYDRLSDSFWPQITGQAISGPSKGVTLEKVQTYWTSWKNWRDAYPSTKVMTDETGHIRNYDNDPYGSYDDNNSYYNSGYPIFPIETYDPRLDDKTVVIGIELNNSYLAVEKNYLRNKKVINTELNGEKITIFYNDDLDVAHVYKRSLNNVTFNFYEDNGKIYDEETNNVWSFFGQSEAGNLDNLIYFDVMWFGWNAFFPETNLIM